MYDPARGPRVPVHCRPPRRSSHAAPINVAALATLATLAACAGRNAVWVDPVSTRERVVFHISNGPGSTAPPSYFYGLTVMSCGGNQVLWTLRNSETVSASRPARIVYGEPPRGYFSADGPRPLRPGCYRVVVSGPASTEFRIAADGATLRRRTPTASLQPYFAPT
jgi:hypothetical protein